jgi:hypothetical protein
MTPLTNSQIAAAKTAYLKGLPCDNGHATQVSQMRGLKRSHSIVWSTGGAEIRDHHQSVIYRGTLAECEVETVRRGLEY